MNQMEIKRLNDVKRFRIFDFDLNKNLQGILKLAADIYESPAAFITLIDNHDQWFKVKHGFEVSRMPRKTSFCTHTIDHHQTLVVSDAHKDERFADNPFVKEVPNIRFYAGAPLATYDGNNIGTLCVMDVRPKAISQEKKTHLEILAKQAIHLMELELTYKLLNEKMRQIEQQNTALMDIAFIQSHEFRGPLSTLIGLMNVIKEEDYVNPKEYLIMMESVIDKLDEKIHIVVKSTEIAKKAYVAIS
jgi:GAF domain-containing protein